MLLAGCDRHTSNELGSFGPDFTAGGGFAVPVSDDFGAEQARKLYEQISTAAFHDALLKYNCGDPVPQMVFNVKLFKQALYASRRVQVGYSAQLDPGGRQRGLVFGLSYQIEKATCDVDPTKSWVKTCRKSTGKTFEAKGGYDNPEPTCDCSKRDSGEEWVTFGPEETPGK